MAQLKNAKIYRGGVTARTIYQESTKCTFESSKIDKGLDFRFSLASKGGGRTAILLQLGLGDLALVLKEAANVFPECLDLLIECTAIANQKRNDELEQTQRKAKFLGKEHVLANTMFLMNCIFGGGPLERFKEIIAIPNENSSIPTEFSLITDTMDDMLGSLSEKEEKVLRLRFGISPGGRQYTLEEVGSVFNLSKERIRQIELKALRKMRHPTRSRILKSYISRE